MRNWSFARVAWVLVGIGLLLAVGVVLTGALLAGALVVGLAVLNVLYLPRLAARLRLRVGWLALVLLPLLLLIGVLANGALGAAWGAAAWVVGIGVPRLIGRDLVRRARRRFGAPVTIETTGRQVGSSRLPLPRTSGVSTTPTARPDGRPWSPADGPGRDGYGL